MAKEILQGPYVETLGPDSFRATVVVWPPHFKHRYCVEGNRKEVTDALKYVLHWKHIPGSGWTQLAKSGFMDVRGLIPADVFCNQKPIF